MVRRQYKQLIALCTFLPCMASAAVTTSAPTYFENTAPASLADHLHLSHSHDPVDGGWLPDLVGLPTLSQINLLTKRVSDVMMSDTDKQCTSIDWNLRMMIFQHFMIYQHIANAQNIYFTHSMTQQWAHVLAMILKESNGDSANVTDMSGHSMSTNKPSTDLQKWRQILSLVQNDHVKLNAKTNFGLSQTSADRLFVAFRLAQNQAYDTGFLEGREGANTPRKIMLNTAIAVRRFIWFYQDFAQGRLSQEDSRIHQQDIHQPQFASRYQDGLNMALLYCGTPFMFHEGQSTQGTQGFSALQNAMASIAYCKLGNAQTGYGQNTMDEMCYAQWVTLCPALNIDIATLTPLSYFATRNQRPVCEATFNKLLNQRSWYDSVMNWF